MQRSCFGERDWKAESCEPPGSEIRLREVAELGEVCSNREIVIFQALDAFDFAFTFDCSLLDLVFGLISE